MKHYFDDTRQAQMTLLSVEEIEEKTNSFARERLILYIELLAQVLNAEFEDDGLPLVNILAIKRK